MMMMVMMMIVASMVVMIMIMMIIEGVRVMLMMIIIVLVVVVVMMMVLGELVKEKCPEVARHMEKEQVPWSIPTTKWFVCLFLDVLPIEVGQQSWGEWRG